VAHVHRLLGVLILCIWKFFPMLTLNINISVKHAGVVVVSLVVWIAGNFIIYAILEGTSPRPPLSCQRRGGIADR